MNSYINNLLNFFISFSSELYNNNIISKINYDQINIDYISKNKQGDVSTNLYLIIKKKIIDKEFNFEKKLDEEIKKISFVSKYHISKNGFINIFLKNEIILEYLNDIKNNSFLNTIKYGNNKKVNVEFVSANPTGPIHVAHIRGAVFGDVLSSLYEKMGFSVSREYYVNDAGSQIHKLSISLYKRYCELFNKEIKFNDDEYPGEYLIDIAKEIANKDKDKWINEKEPTYLLYFKNYAVKSLLEKIKNDLNLININFDVFTFESNIEKSKIIENLFNILKNQNLIFEGVLPKPKGDDSNWEPRKQLLFNSSKLLDNEDRAFKKINGEWTYFANDAAYHFDKFNRNFDKLINIWGSDHIGYIPRMKSVVNVFQANPDYLEILTCQIVSLIQNKKKIKMSKRDGNFVTLEDVFNKVGKDPIRYYMISTKNETAIDFDLDNVIEKNKDNNVFYCQYAYARASSVINKANELNIFIKDIEETKFFIKNLTNDEWEIIKKIICYPYLLYQSSLSNEPHRIINYLENICSNFHFIWNKGKDDESLRFIDENNIFRTKTKLFWIQSFRIVLKDIFSLIGIDAHEKM